MCSGNMGRNFSFRFFFQVVFLSFSVILVCFYHGGGSEYDRQEGETEPRKLKKKFNGKALNVDVFLKQDQCVSNLRKNLKQIEGESTNQETVLSKMAKKGNTLRSDRTWKTTKPSSSTPRKKSATISHLRELKWKTSKAISLNRIIQQQDRKETITKEYSKKTLRNRRESKIVPTECPNSTFTIKYENEYKVWKEFSMTYQSQTYYFYMYRVTDDGLQVCNSSDPLVQQRWWNLIATEKRMMAFQQCNAFVDGFHPNIYTLFKNFTVFFHPTKQSFTRQDYGLIFGHFAICSAKLSLSCNDDLVQVKYDEQYNVFKNFSIFYNNTMYDYREYRFNHDSLEICGSNDSRVQVIWRNKNSWEKFKNVYKCYRYYYLLDYIVINRFTVYSVLNSQYFTRNNYAIIDGKPYICGKILRPTSTEYTEEDLLMCMNSIINIKYDDEYQVRTDFSIVYKNKVYDYTEYRVLNDSIKICNSTDNYARNIWKERNKWVKRRMHQKSCNKPIRESWLNPNYYTVNKQLIVYFITSSQYFTTKDYGVDDGKPYICNEKIKPTSTDYTQEDLLMCNDAIINIKYDHEYKVWNNFSILYNNKVYDYTEYRVLNDGINICNSTDNDARNIWKVRNKWLKRRMHQKQCNKPIKESWLKPDYYIVNKQLAVYFILSSQYFTTNDYGVDDGKPNICNEKIKPTSTEYTQKDLLMCNDSIINIKYDDKYKVWDNFSILYKNKMYDYTEYRVLNAGIKICNSTDQHARNIWKERTKWVKERMHKKSCNKDNYVEYNKGYYKLLKNFKVLILYTKQTITEYDYGVDEGKLIICEEKLIRVFSLLPLTLADIAPLCALALSIVSLLSLLVVYCMLPELRALPGLNLMSLSFAFLLWLVYNAIELSLHRRVGTISTIPCARIVITGKFMTFIILMNAAVNIWVLRKTFCGNILLKSDLNKWRRFLKYSFFSWGVPVIITIIYIVIVKMDILRIYHTKRGCAFDNVPDWLGAVTEYGLPCSLLLYNIIMFIYTAYRLRQKLKASSSIAEKSNMVKTRKSFVLLLKLSTTVAITWLPVMFERYIFINVHFYIYMTLWTVALLSGVYIGIAFVFTRRNYQLLKKKYFAAKKTPNNKTMPMNQ